MITAMQAQSLRITRIVRIQYELIEMAGQRHNADDGQLQQQAADQIATIQQRKGLIKVTESESALAKRQMRREGIYDVDAACLAWIWK